MVRKGLSVEEKRGKIMAIYHSSKGIFNLKEIEKAASKQGVVSQSVKVCASMFARLASRGKQLFTLSDSRLLKNLNHLRTEMLVQTVTRGIF